MPRTALALATTAIALTLAACSSDTTPTATPTAPSPTTDDAAAPTTTPIDATASPGPTWIPIPPVTNRRGEPRSAPDPLHPTVGLRPDGIPLTAEGTLVLYAKELNGRNTVEIILVDLGTAQWISSFPLDATFSFTVQLAANRVIVSFGQQLWSYALDGSDGTRLNDDLSINYMRPSPDGSLIAVTGSNEEHPTWVALIDATSGDTLQFVDLQTEAPGWQGEPNPTRWISNTEVLIGALCNCDVVVDGFFDVTVSSDGSATRFSQDPTPERAVSVQIADNYDISCNLGGFNGGRIIRLIDTATNEVLAEVSEDAPVFLGSELAPDGSEALIVSIVADEDLRARLNDALDAGECVDSSIEPRLTDPPLQLALLRAGATQLEVVATRLKVLERWYEGRLPVFICDDEERVGGNTSNWLRDPAPWRDPAGFGVPWGFSSEACQGRGPKIDMRIGNTLVDTGAEGYRVLGFLDPNANSQDTR